MVRRVNQLIQAIAKVDYRCAGEPKGDEQTAWRRASALFAGPEMARALS